MVKEINGEVLEQLIAEGKTVVCDFWASWCGPCRMLAPVMEAVSENFSDRAEFVKVDVDANPEAAMKYGVMSIPNVTVFAGGSEKTKNVGYIPEPAMREFLEKNL